jgi:soluble lytic murein transglycosylase-like protein
MPSIPLPTTQTNFSQGALPYQQISATPEEFGAATGRAIQGVGQTVDQASNETSQTVLMKQQYANESSAMAALNTFQQQASDLMNGNADKGVQGYNTLQGKDAVNAQGSYQQQLQDSYNTARASLNPAAQRMFDMSGRWALRGSIDRMGDHAAQQETVYNYREARAGVELNQQAAVNNADDPDMFANALASTQEASLRSSRIMGLDGDAAEAARKEDLSKIYVDRTTQLATRDPIAAQKFYRDNIGMVEPNVRYGLERMLNETTNSQYAAQDGSTASAAALGSPTQGGLPRNYNADVVKPYTDQQINDIISQVKKPSEYDAQIDKVAGQYNINPTELKMRLVSESGLNPNAVSSQGAKGIAQITDGTAKSLGINQMDPNQAIDGAARLMVQAESGSGGDKGAVDRAYYGGSTTAQGPNTDQYVSNLAAVRNRLYGGNADAPMTADDIEARESDVENQARAVAQQRRPGDSAYADRVVAEAQKNWARTLQQVRSRDASNMDQVLTATMKGGYQSLAELPGALQQTYAQLPARDMLSVQEVFRSNQRAASGEFTPSDPKTFNDVQNRINLPAGDPNRITDPTQVTPLIAHGLSYSDSQKLITEMKDLNSPEMNPFLKQVNGVKQTAQKMLTSSVSAVTIQHPEAAQEAAYRFGFALDQQISSMQKAGKNPSSLFDPSSPDYALTPSRVMSFMPTEAQIVAQQANATRPAAPTGTTPNPFAPASSPAAAPSTGRPGGVQLTPTAAARVRLPGESPAAYLARVGGGQ